MSGVSDDAYWRDVAAAVQRVGVPSARVIAPRELGALVPGIVPYEQCSTVAGEDIAALVVHKGLLDEIGAAWLGDVMTRCQPVFANEVFVVLRPGAADAQVSSSPHYQAFVAAYQARLQVADAAVALHRDFPSTPTRGVAAAPHLSTYLGDHRALTTTVHGHRMFVDTRDVSLAPHILLDGVWESWVTDVFLQLLRPGMVVVDVGANIGYYSVLAAAAVGASGHVHAFEPHAGMADLLYANLRVNGLASHCSVIVKAVHARAERVPFWRYRKHPGSSSLWGSEAIAALHHDSIDTVEVDAVTLDSYFAPGSKVDLLRMDAEGAEPLIVEGAMRMIADNPGIQILSEFAPAALQRSSPDGVAAMHARLSGLGFRARRITTAATLEYASLDELLSARHSDVLFTRA